MSITAENLTEAQRDVLDFIEGYNLSENRPPTLREIQTFCGYASPRAVQHHVEKLLLAGLLVKRGGDRKSRCLFSTRPGAFPVPETPTRPTPTLAFVLPMNPESMQAEVRQGQGRFYNTDRKNKYLSDIVLLSKGHRPAAPLEGPLIVDFLFIHTRILALDAKKHPDGLIPKATRPDRDNLKKGTQDGLSKAGFWKDDAQIFDGRTAKFYAERGGLARIEVTITQL